MKLEAGPELLQQVHQRVAQFDRYVLGQFALHHFQVFVDESGERVHVPIEYRLVSLRVLDQILKVVGRQQIVQILITVVIDLESLSDKLLAVLDVLLDRLYPSLSVDCDLFRTEATGVQNL